MKPDDLEQHLQRRPLRSIPGEWRSEILKAARSVRRPQPATRNPQPTTAWREWLWPCPQAWAGLAAVWIVVLLFNLASRDPVRVAKAPNPAPALELFVALREHRRLLAELIGTPHLIEPQKPFEPKPRSAISHPILPVQFA